MTGRCSHTLRPAVLGVACLPKSPAVLTSILKQPAAKQWGGGHVQLGGRRAKNDCHRWLMNFPAYNIQIMLTEAALLVLIAKLSSIVGLSGVRRNKKCRQVWSCIFLDRQAWPVSENIWVVVVVVLIHNVLGKTLIRFFLVSKRVASIMYINQKPGHCSSFWKGKWPAQTGRRDRRLESV